MKNNLISIILPTYGRDIQFKNAFQSIINQYNTNWELIIINDGDIDIKKYIPSIKNITYIKNTVNQGAPASRNIGIRASKGDLIAYLDDDDEWLPNHLSIPPNVLNNYDFIYSGAQMRKGEKIVPWFNETFSFRKLAERNFIPTPSVLHRKELITKVGYWNEKLKCLQDWDIWCRMLLRTNKIFHRDDVTVQITCSDSSITCLTANRHIRKKTILYIKLKYYLPLLTKSLFKGKYQ